PLVNVLCAPERAEAVQRYVEESRRRSDIERSNVERTKTGVDLGAVASNPVNGAKIPIWIADYVLMGYGTGPLWPCRGTMSGTLSSPPPLACRLSRSSRTWRAPKTPMGSSRLLLRRSRLPRTLVQVT